MRFGLVDRIIELTRGERIVAVKAVSLSEEYLSDHFPTFPLLPGVFMLQALVESASWLLRDARQFAQSLILLREAKNVTYKSFVKPGHLLRMEVVCRRLAPSGGDFEGLGISDQRDVVKARFSLSAELLADRSPALASLDQTMIDAAKATFALLRGPAV